MRYLQGLQSKKLGLALFILTNTASNKKVRTQVCEDCEGWTKTLRASIVLLVPVVPVDKGIAGQSPRAAGVSWYYM